MTTLTPPPEAPADPTAVYAARLQRAQAALHAHGLDYLFVGPSADLFYLTGLDVHQGDRMVLLMVHQEGPAHLIMPRFEADAVQHLPPQIHLEPWDEQDDPAALVKRLTGVPGGADECTVAVGDKLLAGFLLRIQAALPRAAFTNALRVLPPLRLYKDEAEVAGLREAGARADAAYEAFRRLRYTGRTERQLAREISDALRDHDLEVEWGPIVGSGPNGAHPHHGYSDRVIAAGDLIVLDFGGRYRGYQADCTRTVAAGRLPEDEARRVYELVRQGQEAAFQAARPGLTAAALDAVTRDLFTAAGYGQYFSHRLGHGIGLDNKEQPYIVAGNKQVLEPGMAFTIEPGLYLPGRFGVRIEDVVVLHAEGAERMNNTSRELIVVE
jgi:Xaa-Pro aminopeptidase